jgi:hypothetical protein
MCNRSSPPISFCFLTTLIQMDQPGSAGKPLPAKAVLRNGFGKHSSSSPSSARASGRWMLRAGPVQSLLS